MMNLMKKYNMMAQYKKESLKDSIKYSVQFAEYKYLTKRYGRTYMMVCSTKRIMNQD